MGLKLEELARNNIRNIERLVGRRADQMYLPQAMMEVIRSDSLSEPNRVDALRLLVRHGADANRQAFWFTHSRTPMAEAIFRNRQVATVQLLLDSGATARWCLRSALDFGGNSDLLLDVAYRNGNMQVVNLLLDRGHPGEWLLPTLANRGDNAFIVRSLTGACPCVPTAEPRH